MPKMIVLRLPYISIRVLLSLPLLMALTVHKSRGGADPLKPSCRQLEATHECVQSSALLSPVQSSHVAGIADTRQPAPSSENSIPLPSPTALCAAMQCNIATTQTSIVPYEAPSVSCGDATVVLAEQMMPSSTKFGDVVVNTRPNVISIL